MRFLPVLLAFAFLLFVLPVHALESDIGYSRLDPASPFYFLKTVREELELKLALTPRVVRLRNLEFATRRLREARSLVNKNEDLIPATLERYLFYLKNLPEGYVADEEYLTKFRTSLTIHPKVLQQMYDSLSSAPGKTAVRSTLNRMIQRTDVQPEAKREVCQFFTEEASSSGLTQTEQVLLRERAKNCFE